MATKLSGISDINDDKIINLGILQAQKRLQLEKQIEIFQKYCELDVKNIGNEPLFRI